MHPLVWALLIAALVLFILSFAPPMSGYQQTLWISAVVCAVLAIVLHLFVFTGRAAAAPAPGGVEHLVPGITFANATYTGPPSCETMLLTSLNSTTPLRVCAIVRRPPEGGSLHLLTFFTADGLLLDRDLSEWGYDDCFGADPWVSSFSGTLKAMVNCKPPDGGNDRAFFPLDTGVGAEVALP